MRNDIKGDLPIHLEVIKTTKDIIGNASMSSRISLAQSPPNVPPIDRNINNREDGDMEARIVALEEAIKNLPTKTDFAELRADIAKGQADMHKAIADNHRWTHGALIGIGTIATAGILGVVSTIWSMGKPPSTAPAPVQSSPIIINVPNAAPAAAPAAAPRQ